MSTRIDSISTVDKHFNKCTVVILTELPGVGEGEAEDKVEGEGEGESVDEGGGELLVTVAEDVPVALAPSLAITVALQEYWPAEVATRSDLQNPPLGTVWATTGDSDQHNAATRAHQDWLSALNGYSVPLPRNITSELVQ